MTRDMTSMSCLNESRFGTVPEIEAVGTGSGRPTKKVTIEKAGVLEEVD